MALVAARLRRSHPDLEKQPLTVTAEHRSSMDVVTAKLMKLAHGFVIFIFAWVLLNGRATAGAPSFELFGAFFPAWLFCGLIGLVASGAARGLFVSTGLSHLVPYQLFVCVAIGVIAACLAWLLWFGW
jgi:hypothetical protein